MSNEPVKLGEVDCAVAPYSRHHHHHHHHHHHLHHLQPHQNSHLQHSHNLHLTDHHHPESHESPPHNYEETSNEVDDGNEMENVGENQDKVNHEQDELIENDEQKVHFECKEGQLDGSIKLITKNQRDHSQIDTIEKHLTQLQNVISQSEVESSADALGHHQQDPVSPRLTSLSGNSDTSESDSDEDADGDSDDDEESEEDSDAGEDGEDEDEYDDDEIDEDDIVDPVGNQTNSHLQQLNINGYDCSADINCYNQISNIHESTSDDDVMFDNESDESERAHINTTPDLLDSERMLEVTRKLFRNTERDPDRDLRKQVLLRTAIRKLPHFMDYNHYSDSFDQSFQMHNSTLDSSNTSVNCMSPSQYYEHNHLNHHMEPQPKSYYHSVQPNAIQMSTTSLRMLDLNDESETEQAVTSIESKQHDEHSFETHTDLENNVTDAGLEHDYANHHIYTQHYTSLESQPTNPIHEHNNQGAIHDFSQYENSQDSNSAMIARHSTLDNLYQPLDGIDLSDDLKSTEQPNAFQTACDYSRVAVADDYEGVVGDVLNDANDINDTMINESTHQDNILNLDKEETLANSHRMNNDHQYQKDHDCNQNQTHTTAFYDSIETQQDSLYLEKLETSNLISPILHTNETNLEGTIETSDEDQSGCSEGGSSNSSQSSTASDDSVNSTSSQSNDSAGGLNGISILETSLNSSDEYNRYNHSHDSGVALFSPRSNKRSSSSVGLDDEMEIDHLTDLTSSNQFNSGGSLSTLNQCKRMRKREIID